MDNRKEKQIMEILMAEFMAKKNNSISENMKNNIGIGYLHPGYIETNKIQNKNEEYQKITDFLNKYIHKYAEKRGINSEDLDLEFINYGKTELVYVLTEKNGNRVTLLVKQPIVPFGKIKQEAQNLLTLEKNHSNIIAPIDYFQTENQELYVTPYINQARCVASYGGYWGMYIPEPFYRFEPFNTEQEKIVTSCMIAKLVSLYDFSKQEGICSCKLGGGDFMLPKGWENEKSSLENTLNNLYLIAARERINCSFNDYLELIRNEFCRETISENPEKLIMNLRGRVPMQMENIESGIVLGKAIINNKSQVNNKPNNNKINSKDYDKEI